MMKKAMIDGLVDVHCHLLPYVDDGAQNLEQALQLLRLQREQGVETCFLTVHQRAKMFETPQEKVNEKFHQLQEAAKELPNAPKLFLARENHVDQAFFSLLKDGKAQSLGASPYILLEFSYKDPEDFFFKTVELVQKEGFIPVIAHIERYEVMHQNASLRQNLREKGALLQVNASSVMGKEGFRQKMFCRKLLKADQIDLIASDSHRTDVRVPNLGDCAAWLKKRIPGEQWERIFYKNTEQIIAQTKSEIAI